MVHLLVYVHIQGLREYNDGNTIAESVKNYALQANNSREFNEKNTEANISRNL